LIVATTVACAGCHLPLRHPPGRDGITRILERQADAWNRGDIDAFMDAYDRSPGLTFSSGGRVTRGWEPTLANYHRRYPNREAMGHLTFSQLEITTLGQDAALVLGRWKLHRAEPIGGVFTLVFRRHAGRWVIVHDHTSKAPAD
jgi:beta-aspartyl-peptidase (threonine type)